MKSDPKHLTPGGLYTQEQCDAFVDRVFKTQLDMTTKTFRIVDKDGNEVKCKHVWDGLTINQIRQALNLDDVDDVDDSVTCSICGIAKSKV